MDPQIVNIVKYLIRETPIGHLKTLLDNLKVIVGFEVIDCKEVNDEILLYEQEHLKQIDLGGDKIILSKFNKDGNDYFHDQQQGLKIKAVANLENAEKIEKIEQSDDNLRSLLHKAFLKYRDTNFKKEISAANGKFII